MADAASLGVALYPDDGAAVVDLWLTDELHRIVQYNEYDALTTYLVWLRLAHFAGFFDDAGYREEQSLVEQLVTTIRWWAQCSRRKLLICSSVPASPGRNRRRNGDPSGE